MRGNGRLSIRACVAGEGSDRPRLDVDFEVGQGITAVMGPSGSGKTTLLTAVAGLLRPASGRLVLDGAVLFDSDAQVSLPPHQRRIAIVFQSLALFPHMTAWENVAYGLPSRATPARIPLRSRKERALGWLARTRVGHVAERLPSTLSGGEAQRVALARALASEPKALLLDEPFSAMHAELREQLGAELRGLVEELGLPTLFVTHHLEDAKKLGSRVLVLDAGRFASDP